MRKILFFLLIACWSAKAQQFSLPALPSYEICDGDNDGIAIFDLESFYGPQVLMQVPGNAQDYAVSYFLTQAEALQNVASNAISTPLAYANANYAQTIFIRVHEIVNPSHFAIAAATLIVYPAPVVSPISTLFVSFSNPAASVDLYAHLLPYFGGNPDISIAFYHTMADAQAAQNAIAQSCCYTPASDERLYVSLTNSGGCSTVAYFDVSLVVEIPDPVLRQRIFSSYANGWEMVAGHYDNPVLIPINVDANGDGHIQVSEALQVDYLNVNGDSWWSSPGTIADLTGLEAFSNLKFLYFAENAVSEFNFPNLNQLQILRMRNNQVTGIDFSAFPELGTADVSANLFTSLDFSANPVFFDLGCSNNPNLVSINLKNGHLQNCGVGNWSFDGWIYTPNLATVCADAGELDCLQQAVTEYGEHPDTVFSSDCNLSVPVALKHDVVLFPNPTASKLEVKSASEIVGLSLSDANGRSVNVKRFENTLDLTGLSAGVYLVRIETANGIAIRKVCKI